MRVLGAIVEQQQNLRGADTVGEQVQERLALSVDPVQVLENHHEGLIERLAQQDALNRFHRPPASDLRIHLGQRIFAFDQAEQAQEIGQSVLQRAIQGQDLAVDLLAPGALVIFRRNSEILVQQIDQRQISRGLAVRNRKGLQHHPARLRDGLEFVEEPGLPDSRLSHYRDDLTAPLPGQIRRAAHRVHFNLPADELGQSPSGGALKARA